MKRFHVHVAVSDLPASIDFYSRLFGQSPSVSHLDYAKWMIDDPRLNFAISARGHAAGLNHLGFQAESVEELDTLRQRALAAAPDEDLTQTSAQCCYAVSDKPWTLDPQGIAWEHFQTQQQTQRFGEDRHTPKGACCIPLHAGAA